MATAERGGHNEEVVFGVFLKEEVIVFLFVAYAVDEPHVVYIKALHAKFVIF